MKKKLIYTVSAFVVASLLLFSSCEANNEVIPEGKEGEKVEVEIVFGVEPYAAPVLDTRSDSATDEQGGIVVTYHNDLIQTKAEDPDDRIESICIFQFESTGTNTDATDKLLAKIKLPVSSLAKSADSKGNTVYSAKVELEKRANCQLFFAANEPESSFFDAFLVETATVKNYKDREQVFTDLSSFGVLYEIETGERPIPMAGYYKGALPAPDVTVWLTRLFAKITVSAVFVEGDDTYSLDGNPGMSIKHITDRYKYFDQGRYSGGYYPAISYEKSDFSLPYNSGDAIYIPENRRGVNTDITQQKNKYRKSDPSWDGTDWYSTYIELSGKLFRLEDGHWNRKRFIISLFPGENITTDFNIRGNTRYVITATIKNLDDDDDRIFLEGIQY